MVDTMSDEERQAQKEISKGIIFTVTDDYPLTQKASVMWRAAGRAKCEPRLTSKQKRRRAAKARQT